MARKEGGEESEEGDGDGDGDDENSVSVMMTGVMDENGDSQFSKCVIHLSMKWNSDKFKTFLDELVCSFLLAIVFDFKMVLVSTGKGEY